MEFGLLKTKIEESLNNSFNRKTLKKDIFVFNELVLENKDVARLYFLYDELSSNKGLNESLATEFINESVKMYNQISKNISKTNLKEIQMWVGHLKCENKYKHIDNLFSKDVSSLEDKLKSKSFVAESLNKPKLVYDGPNVKLPLDKVVNAANKTVNEYLSKLDESEKKDLLKVLKEKDSKLEIEFEVLKESVVSRLSNLKKEETDNEVLNTINETIIKVDEETFSRDGYLKLKRLNNNI
jgi:hypothetical protein